MSRTTWRQILRITAFAAVSNVLFAVDGVTLIDPRGIRQGGITPGDAPGFPVTLSQPGSYRLVGNITVPDTSTTAIEITANNVTLDLNGFSIMGPNVCTPNPTRCTYSGGGIGILASAPVGVVSPAGVRVMNGMVRGMGFHGIRMMGDGVVVERVHATSNGGPGIVVGNGSVIDSIVTLSGSGAAIVGTIVRGCISSQNAVLGIFVRPGGVAIGNAAMLNGGSGISVNTGTATGNTANNNGSFGIEASCPASIVGNTTFGNQGGSVRTTGVCTLAENAQ